MKNMTHYEMLPLKEAWEKYRAEQDAGKIANDVDFTEWLVDHEYDGTDTDGGDTVDDEPTRYSPFKKLKVSCDVLWDYDEGETPPDPHFEVEFTPEELENENILDRSNMEVIDWELYENRLEEFISDYMTFYTDFCHKGFDMKFQPVP